jgi:hypothetical protein
VSDEGRVVSEVERVTGEVDVTLCRGLHPTRWQYAATSSPCHECRVGAEQIEPLIVERERAAQAEALREAAEEFDGPVSPLHIMGAAAALRERATRIAQDAPESTTDEREWHEGGDGHGYVYQYIGPIHYLCECGEYFLNRERWLAHKPEGAHTAPRDAAELLGRIERLEGSS